MKKTAKQEASSGEPAKPRQKARMSRRRFKRKSGMFASKLHKKGTGKRPNQKSKQEPSPMDSDNEPPDHSWESPSMWMAGSQLVLWLWYLFPKGPTYWIKKMQTELYATTSELKQSFRANSTDTEQKIYDFIAKEKKIQTALENSDVQIRDECDIRLMVPNSVMPSHTGSLFGYLLSSKKYQFYGRQLLQSCYHCLVSAMELLGGLEYVNNYYDLVGKNGVIETNIQHRFKISFEKTRESSQDITDEDYLWYVKTLIATVQNQATESTFWHLLTDAIETRSGCNKFLPGIFTDIFFVYTCEIDNTYQLLCTHSTIVNKCFETQFKCVEEMWEILKVDPEQCFNRIYNAIAEVCKAKEIIDNECEQTTCTALCLFEFLHMHTNLQPNLQFAYYDMVQYCKKAQRGDLDAYEEDTLKISIQQYIVDQYDAESKLGASPVEHASEYIFSGTLKEMTLENKKGEMIGLLIPAKKKLFDIRLQKSECSDEFFGVRLPK